jgi:hypothetical protein
MIHTIAGLVDILNEIDKDEQFLYRVMFSDEATFHVSGHVHRNNIKNMG